MSALTADRDTPRRSGDLIVVPVRSTVATTIYAGSLVAVFVDEGVAVPGGTVIGEGIFYLAGVAEETVHNPQGGTATVKVRRQGTFQFACTPGSLIPGALADILDDQTVGPYVKTSSRTLVGAVVEVEGDGDSVWVELAPALSAIARLYAPAAE